MYWIYSLYLSHIDIESDTLEDDLEEDDCSLLPKPVWDLLVSWYGLSVGSQPICRQVIITLCLLVDIQSVLMILRLICSSCYKTWSLRYKYLCMFTHIDFRCIQQSLNLIFTGNVRIIDMTNHI